MRVTRAFRWAASAALLLAAGCAESPQVTPPTTMAEALRQAARLKKPVLVEFFTTW